MKKRFDNTNDDARLHALLQIKRLERPDDHCWQRFEQGLERKQLAAIVGTRERVEHGSWRTIFGKRLAYTLCAVSLCLLGTTTVVHIMNIGNDRYYDKIVEVSSGSPTEYVCDPLVPECTFFSDHGVAMNLHDHGVGYVRDAIPFGATTSNIATSVASVY